MEDGKSLLSYICESDIPFEMQLVKDSQNKEIWDQYFKHKQEQLVNREGEKKIDDNLNLRKGILALLFRQYQQFSNDFDCWLSFVDNYIDFIKVNNSNTCELNKLNQFFSNSIIILGEKIEFWMKYLEFLNVFKELLDFEFISCVFNSAMLELKQIEHLKLWEFLFNSILNELDISLKLKFEIYSSFFIYLKNCIKFNITIEEHNIPTFDNIFSNLINCLNDYSEIIKFEIIFNEFLVPQILLKLSDSELELYRRYFDKLIKISNIRKNENDINEIKLKINSVFKIIVNKFPDQQSIFTIRYAKYLIYIDKFEDSIQLLEKYLNLSLTIKDFTIIFDSLTEILEKKVTELSEFESNDDNNNKKNHEILNKYLDKFELLLSNRSLLLNDVKLRQNSNSPLIWLERLELLNEFYIDNNVGSLSKLLDCYSKAILVIDVKKIPKDEKLLFPKIWYDYAKFYFNKNDIKTGRKIFETGTKVPWTDIEQLEFIWIEWIKLEIEIGNIEHATLICYKAISIPEQISNGKISIDDKNLSVHMKLFKSIKLWSLYLDLIENTKKYDEICKAYEDSMELKVINGVMIINYCLYLEENGYIEKSFSIFERGLNMFNGETKSILFCIYLNKIIKYWDKLNWNIERVREIFEESLEFYDKDNKNLKQIYILYSEWEMKYGSKIRSSKILKEGINKMRKQSDKLLMYKILIVNTIENKGLEWVVEIFQEATENISVKIPGYINDIIGGFVEVEILLGNINRGREILQYAAENIMEFSENKEDKNSIWDLFKAFELENGDESTYKDMLRKKIYLENLYGSLEDSKELDSSQTLQESKNAQLRKEFQDRIGFIASSNGPKTTTFVSETVDDDDEKEPVSKNNDAIELDMDI